MFVQIVDMEVPGEQSDELRILLSTVYLPLCQDEVGFISARLLEQVDGPNMTKLMMYWNSQAEAEESGIVGLLAHSPDSIPTYIPHARIRCQSHIVSVNTRQLCVA